LVLSPGGEPYNETQPGDSISVERRDGVDRPDGSSQALLITETSPLPGLTEFLINLRDAVANLDTKLTNLETKIADNFTNLDKRVANLEAKIDAVYEYITGSKAIAIASASAVKIEISPEKGDRENTFASGCYVRIDDLYYVATNRHIAAVQNQDDEFRERRTITSLAMINGVTLRQTGDSFWREDDGCDIALIPVLPDPRSTAVEIADTEPSFGIPLHGVAYRPHRVVYLSGNVVAKHSLTFEMDCRRTHGFSGTGYIDGAGRLFAINCDTEHFTRLPSSGETNAPAQAIARPPNRIGVTARNPGTSVCPAVYLLELARNPHPHPPPTPTHPMTPRQRRST
jgi:hypothetical protein